MEMWKQVEEVPRRREEQEREPIGDGLADGFINEKASGFHKGHSIHKGTSFISKLFLEQLLCVQACERCYKI